MVVCEPMGALGEARISPAFAAVENAVHPSPEQGGPCATCAFRKGTEANQTAHTVALAQLCVEGLTAFHCHEKPQACRGWIAAVNARHAAGDIEAAGPEHLAASREFAELLAIIIERAKAAQEAR